MFLLILLIKFEKLILHPNILLHISDKLDVIRDIIFIISSQIQRDEFIIAIKIIHLNINCFGVSTLEYVKCESKKVIE